jgi:hypothetical protein
MRRVLWIVLAAAIACALAYLRDPPWLAQVESGFRGWETAPDGIRYRWTDGHASFFVPADATSLTMPIRTTFDAPEDPPVLVSLSIDDRAADELILRDPGWQVRRLRMPAPGRRRLRRIDVRIDRLRDGNRGVQLGDVQVHRSRH